MGLALCIGAGLHLGDAVVGIPSQSLGTGSGVAVVQGVGLVFLVIHLTHVPTDEVVGVVHALVAASRRRPVCRRQGPLLRRATAAEAGKDTLRGPRVILSEAR